MGISIRLGLFVFIFAQVSSGQTAPESPRDTIYKYPKAHKVILHPRDLGACMAVATLEDKMPAYISTKEMKLSVVHPIPQCKAVVGTPPAPSFFSYLAAWPCRHYDYVTGQEESLKAWVLSQPENSIDPVAIYQASLRLNNFNIWNTLLTVHELVRNMARWQDKPRYNYETTILEAIQFFNKFIDIRGTLYELGGPKNKGDHPGSWYRIWGTMLYRLHLGAPYFSAKDLQANSVYFIDEIVLKGTLSHIGDPGKFDMDVRGSVAIDWLMRGLANPARLQRSRFNSQSCASRPYLTDAK